MGLTRRTCVSAFIHTRDCAYVRIYARATMRMCVYTHILTYAKVCSYTRSRVCVGLRRRAYAYTGARTHAH